MRAQRDLAALALVLCIGAASSQPARGQCILANPSFEIGGSGGITFAGWNQFGVVGSVTGAYHGAKAARVSGPNYGGWDVSGYWQRQDCAPGEQWGATGHVRHPSGKPLTGQSVALVNIEWRDAAGSLIDYESFTVADASSPADEYLDFFLVSEEAPAGTVATHALFGVLQSPDDPSPDVHYDQVTFNRLTAPTLDDLQWSDFPGGNTVFFGDHTWRVKGPGFYGPGGNFFCDTADCVWVDAQGRLHLTLKFDGRYWFSTEVATERALGYGDYILTTVGRLDLIDPYAVLGIFLWEYGPCWDTDYLWWNAFNEIDIEYSRWADPASDIGQFVAQPYDYPGNIVHFDAVFGADEVVSHAMRWLADRVEFRVWRGGPADESATTLIRAWTYTGPHIPRPEQPRMHLNLWKLAGAPAGNQEVVFQDFTFVPAGGPTAVRDELPTSLAGRLHPAAPNPFNPQTTVRFELTRGGPARLDVYDLAGRRVRNLVATDLAAGTHESTWDGRDDRGQPLSSGVYVLRLRAGDFAQSRRVALIK